MTRKSKTSSSQLFVPAGFRVGGITNATTATGDQKLGMILCDDPSPAAIVTTKNVFAAPPVVYCRERMSRGRRIGGIIVNSGSANAAMGEQGMRDAAAMAKQAEVDTGAAKGSFLVASTGSIGMPLKTDKVLKTVPRLVRSLSPDGWADFTQAIMTTDTVAKIASEKIALPKGGHASILGVAKGAGMIRPDMATMLVFLATDFPLSSAQCKRHLRRAVDLSFHCLTIDDQCSTNDTVLLLSSGQADGGPSTPSHLHEGFGAALLRICQDLARKIAADGEGATKLVEIEVTGARTDAQCRKLAMEVGNSALVKTAIFGEDPNWGRIIQALGQAGVSFQPELVGVKFQGVEVMGKGTAKKFDRARLKKKMKADEIRIEIRVSSAKTKSTIWTCDLTHGYIDVNTKYN